MSYRGRGLNFYFLLLLFFFYYFLSFFVIFDRVLQQVWHKRDNKVMSMLNFDFDLPG